LGVQSWGFLSLWRLEGGATAGGEAAWRLSVLGADPAVEGPDRCGVDGGGAVPELFDDGSGRGEGGFDQAGW
jgi:hypothetical protein